MDENKLELLTNYFNTYGRRDSEETARFLWLNELCFGYEGIRPEVLIKTGGFVLQDSKRLGIPSDSSLLPMFVRRAFLKGLAVATPEILEFFQSYKEAKKDECSRVVLPSLKFSAHTTNFLDNICFFDPLLWEDIRAYNSDIDSELRKVSLVYIVSAMDAQEKGFMKAIPDVYPTSTKKFFDYF